jgi:ATP-dependent Lon protease
MVEEPSFADLYDTGCVALATAIVPQNEAVWVVLRGVAWPKFDGVESEGTHLVARVSAIAIEPDDDGDATQLAAKLRREAKRLARRTAPESERFIDEIADAGALADAMMSNLPGTVAEKVAYAAERRVATKLRRALDAVRARRRDTGVERPPLPSGARLSRARIGEGSSQRALAPESDPP